MGGGGRWGAIGGLKQPFKHKINGNKVVTAKRDSKFLSFLCTFYIKFEQILCIMKDNKCFVE